MRVTVVYNQPADSAAADDADVLAQVAAASAAMKRRGHEIREVPCTLDLATLESELRRNAPDVVFNLVESLGGHARLIHAIPYLLESLGIPFTGSCADAVMMTSHKVLAKERMKAAGLPTPPWAGQHSRETVSNLAPEVPAQGDAQADARPLRGWMVKSLWEHASIGLDECETVISYSLVEARQTMHRHAASYGNACFAEQFIDGREFNLSLLAGEGGPRVLRPAEIVFEAYPPGKLRIVGYRAKWDPDSYEYSHTPRRFSFSTEDRGLLKELKRLALACWRAFDLGGYARVDFRVDENGRPWILEVNANPCLSPDAGFAAALAESGIGFDESVDTILQDALRRSGKKP